MQGRFAEVMFAGVMMLAWVMLTAPQALAPQYQLVQGIIPFSPSSPSHWTVGQSPDSLDCTCEVCGRSPAPIVTCPVRALGLRSQHWVGGCLPALHPQGVGRRPSQTRVLVCLTKPFDTHLP